MEYHLTSSLWPQRRRLEEDRKRFYQSNTQHFHSAGIPLKPTIKSSAIQEYHEREKRELNELNERFASYIERVRYLEAQNKKLQLEIDYLKNNRDIKISKVKEIYEIDIRKAHDVIDDTIKDCAAANLRTKNTEEKALKLKDKYELLVSGRHSEKEKIEFLQNELLHNEADLDLFHRRLIDLEDEQNRYQTESRKLILDIQRITKDLNHEILARVELENQKQNLEDEIHYLKEIHSQEIEQLKQTNLIDTSLDSKNFFKYELSNAIKNIRQEYEQQRNEMESSYRIKLTQAMQELQSHRTPVKSQQEEIKKLRTLVFDTQEDIEIIRRRNEELENRIHELEEHIEIETNNNIRASNERDNKIKNLRVRLEDLGRDYDELISTKSTLDSEIAIYRKLLEGEEKRGGLKQIVTNIEDQVRRNLLTTDDSNRSSTYSYQRTSDSHGFGNNKLTLTPYQPLSSTRTESTIFEQVYGKQPRRPPSISLNVQWIPVSDQPRINRWNRSDINSRKLKTWTFFGTDIIQEQNSPKAVTPPSSDYTDAYLSAFAPKPIPPRRFYRLNTPVFVNVAPIPSKPARTNLFTNDSIKTSETRFNNIQTSKSFDKSVPPFPTTIIPDISTKSEPFSSLDTQTSELSHENFDNFISSQPSTSAHKPTVLFQSPPLPFANDVHQSSTNKQTVLSSSNIDKQVTRPETLLFQPDEDIGSSSIEKPSPIITPLLESPITRIESPIEPAHTSTDASSKPIEILENTLVKYDSLINQISEVLASVSPLSSTVSSMSPGKSVLDYELTADGSPILPRKEVESQQSITSVRNISMQRIKGKHLIRGDSYDKIVTAIADLDTELTPPPDIQNRTTVIEEENSESMATLEEYQNSSLPDEKKDETEIVLADEQQQPSVIKTEENEQQISSLLSSGILSNASSLDDENLPDTEAIIEIPSNTSEFIQQQTDSLPDIPNDEVVEQEINETNDEAISSSKIEKHVRWRERIMTSEDEESSLSDSFTEEHIPSEIPISINDNEQQTTDEITTVDPLDLEMVDSNSTETLTNTLKRQIKSSSPSETSSSSSDSVERQTPPSDFNESRSSHDEQAISSRSSVDSPITTAMNSLNKNTEILTQINESTIPSLLPIIVSPIDTLTDSISTRYISNDVYHGYLGEHIKFKENLSDVDTENENISLLTNLRQSIATSVTPLIEAIQSVVSDTQTNPTTVSYPQADIQSILSAEQIESVPEDRKDSTSLQTASSHEKFEDYSTSPSFSDPIEDKISDNNANIIEPTEEQDTPMMRSPSSEIPATLSSEDNVTNRSEIISTEPALLKTSETAFETQKLDQADTKNFEEKIDDTTPSSANIYTNIEQVLSTEITPEKEQFVAEKQNVSTYISNEDNEIIQDTVHELINDITQTIVSNLEVSSLDHDLIKSITPICDDVMQRSTTGFESDSISVDTEIENIPSKLSSDHRESSPTNTEPDSLELMHALRGHSIAQPNSPEQILHQPEKSSSSTTPSSQITSSDRYVSYAIHQMGDSSQDRLPSFPIAADLPVYKNREENQLYQSILKEDDSTEFDATENLTSNSDDVFLQKLYRASGNRQKDFDTSSTDDDVDEEFEQHDLTDIHRILDKLTIPEQNLNTNEQYQRYDLATTPSSNDSSSSRHQPDDVYLIPGYPGLWRPSVDNDSSSLPIDYDADDERKSSTKTRIITGTSDSSRRPLIFPQHQSTNSPIRPNTINISSRPLNEYSLDQSESESYHTCPSSISKPVKQSDLSAITKSNEQTETTSPDENILLIRERERGVSLPITMKIDCDDIAWRLSTSTPAEAQLNSTTLQPDLSSPSTHSEPPIPTKIDSNSQASSPALSLHETDQHKLPAWLNTVNTVTTTTEGTIGPLESRVTILKSAKGPISISECHPQGNYIIIENTSRSKNIDLSNWTIRQENDKGENLIFTFPDNCLLKPTQSIKILTNTNESEEKSNELIASSISSWYTGPNILTVLFNPEGKDRATLTKKTILS